MKNRPLTNEAGEVRELTRQDIREMQPANKVLPKELCDILLKCSEIIRLSASEQVYFLKSLLSSSEPNSALKRAFKNHKKLIRSAE